MTEDEKLKRAIAQFEAQRDILGEDAVQAASAVLLQRLAALRPSERHASRPEQQGMGSRLVGRKAEFGVIKSRIEHLIEGQGRFVSLIGEAGIGKSRLVSELRNEICPPDADLPVQWLEGSAGSEGRTTSYGLFRRIIRRYADIAEQDDEVGAVNKLQSRLAALLEEESTEILPFLASMLALPVRGECAERVKDLNDEEMRCAVFAATQRLFERLARKRSLVLVLEDLQWIDESSVTLVQHLLPLLYRRPILVLGTGRLTVGTSHARLRELMATVYHDRYDEIRLPPLSPLESEKLIADLLCDEDHALFLTDKVVEQTGGNPLLIEETLRPLIHVDYERPYAYTPKELADKIFADRSAMVGQRKLVTVMCADLAGFTRMADKLDPEHVRRIVTACFRIIAGEVHACEGMVNEFRDGRIMALFGAPIASDEHAQRGCYACLAIRKALVPFEENLKTRYGLDFKVRLGLHSGPVVVDGIGDDLHMDFTAQGEMTTIASWMESSAKPGTVLASEQTYRLAKDFFEFEPLGKLKVKGMDHPVETYRLREKAYQPRVRSEREVYSEMIGRDQELSRLELQVLKAVNGEGSVVNVIGEAGIGKSRLLTELRKRDVVQRVAFLEGRAISIGKNLSFHPIIDLLKHWAHIQEDDPATVGLDKLEAAVRRVCTDQADEVFPFVATMIGMKLSGRHADRVRGIEGEPLEKLILKNVRALLARVTNIIPVVVLMEDMHWADASSLLLLEHVYRLALTQRIVFINLLRPGYGDGDDGALEALKARAPDLPLAEILLRPLDPQNSEAIINNVLNIKGPQPSARTQIIEKAGGNPFFIEEIVRSLIDEGAVKVGDDGFQVTEKIDLVAIPPTINELLMGRIDRLDEESRHLVKVASVLGRSFFYRILADVLGREEGLDNKLADLDRIQLIRRQMRMEEVEYSFQHALAQEAAYGSIPFERRRRLHFEIAESIERIFSERLHEFYGMLAYHYLSDDCPEKAEAYLIKAGEEALKSAASNEALHYYQEALNIYRTLLGAEVDPEKVAMLEKNIALALFNRGRYAEAVEYFDKALGYYWGRLPNNSLSTACRFLSNFMKFLCALYFPSLWFKKIPTQQDAEVVDLYFKKLKCFSLFNPKRFFIECFFFHGMIIRFNPTELKLGAPLVAGIASLFSFSGLSHSTARRILDSVKSKVIREDPKQCVTYDLWDTIALFLNGQWQKITELDEDLVSRILRIGETWDAAMYYYWHGLAELYQGHFDTAQVIATRLTELSETYENDHYHLFKHLLNSHLLIEQRRLDEAISELNGALDLFQGKEWGVSTLHMLALKASTHLLLKETEEAGESLDRADRIRSEATVAPVQLAPFYRGELQYYLRRLEESLKAGRKKESSEYRKRVLKSGKRLIKTCEKAAWYRPESYRLLGVYHWLIQDRKNAFTWLHKAIREGEKIGARPQVARTYATMALYARSVKGRKPVLPKAKEYLQTARTMFRELGMQYDLEELNSAISRDRLEAFEV